ncbi:DUF4373 domain-containing protein [Butyricimonas synergistica]|uniref:DUF4373 domain-containing protein n=1 Tax=Butyricimonas synergistica TaxID=544644 RepID=UPI0022E7CC7D|nr:DUF4373 domain-containing protein [Butyricimonas synergistica]
MARPNKKGLDYFPVDVDMFETDDVALITSEFGAKADSVLIRLLCRIYKNGYWCKWGDDECSLFCKLAGGIFVPNHVREIVAGCVRRSIFDKSVFNMFGVLTSKEIQEKYLRATLERKEIEIVADYWLLDIPEGGRFGVVDVDGNCIRKINRSINAVNRSNNLKNDRDGKDEILEFGVNRPKNDVNRSNNRVNRSNSTQSKVNSIYTKYSFGEFWDLYDKKRGDKAKIEKKWMKLTEVERESAMKYIPRYKESQPDKKFRKDPDTFLNNKSWNDELIYMNNERPKQTQSVDIGKY